MIIKFFSHSRPHRRPGASLVEMLVVIAIIAILAALGTGVITAAMNFASGLQAEVDAVKSQLKHSKTVAVHTPRAKTGYVPDQYLIVLVDSADPVATAARLQLSMPLKVLSTFTTTFKGLAVSMPATYVSGLMQDSEVRFVEQDQYMVPSAQTLDNGVKRIGGNLSTTVSGDGKGNLITVNAAQTLMTHTAFDQTFTTNGAAVASSTRPTVGFPFFKNGNMVTNLANNVVQVPTTGPSGSGVVNIGQNNSTTVVGIDVNLVIIDTGVGSVIAGFSTPVHRDLFIIHDKSQQLTQAVTGSASVTNYADGNGHGTLMAGIAAARDDNNDTVGVAPGAKIWAVNVVPTLTAPGEDDVTATTMTRVTTAIDTLTNMRLTASTEADKPHVCYIGFTTGVGAVGAALNTSITALVNAGTVVVVPAGNGNPGADAGTVVPANCSRAITVAAFVDLNGTDGFGVGLSAPFPQIATIVFSTDNGTTLNDYLAPNGEEQIARFSNRNAGTNFVDMIAPGVEIQSTYLANTTRRCTGTSAAAAHVAGLAVLAVDPSARMSQNAVNGRSIFNSLGYINQTPAPPIPDAVDFLMKNLYQYRDINQLFNNNGNMAPNAGLFPNNATINNIPVANARLF